METLFALLAILAGILLRLAVPIAITALAVYLLRRLDEQWQQEAKVSTPTPPKPQCWDIKNCPEERRSNCAGYTSAQPCWQARRMKNGYLQEECLSCSIFLNAPLPAEPFTSNPSYVQGGMHP
jgi:hypothetical protein